MSEAERITIEVCRACSERRRTRRSRYCTECGKRRFTLLPDCVPQELESPDAHCGKCGIGILVLDKFCHMCGVENPATAQK